MDNNISKENLLFSLPAVLGSSSNTSALADAIASALAARVAEINAVKIYPQIDKLPEPLLDILANDFKVDWYDFNADIEEKRRLIKSSFSVHRNIGTYGASLRAVQSVYPGSEIREWFDYGGEPGNFKVAVPNIAFLYENINRIISVLGYAKRLSARLEEMIGTEKSDIRLGVGIAKVQTMSFTCETERVEIGLAYAWLVNEHGDMLTDEHGNILTL